jgi:chitinase
MAGFWSTLMVIVACVLAIDATQVMQKPARYNQSAHTNPVGDTTPEIEKRATGKTQFAYFTNWGIYSGYNFSQS